MRNMNWTAFLSASAEEDYYEQHTGNWSQHSESLAGIFCHQIFESGVVVEMLRTGYLLMWRSDQPSPAQPRPGVRWVKR